MSRHRVCEQRSNSENDFDVVIVGASVAGATTATLLGRAGLRVLLCDKATFPRTKPCGEGLSHVGLAAAQRLGLLPSGAPILSQMLPFNGFQVTAGSISRFIAAPAPGCSVAREAFDTHLVSLASTTAGVQTELGCPARAEIDSSGVISVRVGGLQVSTCHLVVADGARSPIARSLGAHEYRSGPPRVGLAQHWEGAFNSTGNHGRVGILLEEGYELYATPLVDGKLNLALLASSDKVEGPTLRALLCPSASNVAAVLSSVGFHGRPATQIHGRAGIGNVRRYSMHPRVHLVGDAAEEFDPIGGMGMTHALLSAEAVASLIARDLGALSGSSMQKQRVESASRLRAFTQATYRLMRAAYHYPRLLSVAASSLGGQIIGALAP